MRDSGRSGDRGDFLVDAANRGIPFHRPRIDRDRRRPVAARRTDRERPKEARGAGRERVHRSGQPAAVARPGCCRNKPVRPGATVARSGACPDGSRDSMARSSKLMAAVDLVGRGRRAHQPLDGREPSLARLVRRSAEVPDWIVAECRAIAGQLGCSPAVRVRRSTEVPTPFLTGVWHPVLLLPDQSWRDVKPGKRISRNPRPRADACSESRSLLEPCGQPGVDRALVPSAGLAHPSRACLGVRRGL